MGIEVGLAALAGMALSTVMAPKMPTPQIPKAEPPPKESKSQAVKQPDRPASVVANAAAASPGGALSGNSGTFLTGPSGIDPSALNLGKNTLLGQ